MTTRKQKLIKMFYDIFACEDVDTSNQMVDDLFRSLRFKNESQKEKWLDLMFSFKFFEDMEKLTLEIINQD